MEITWEGIVVGFLILVVVCFIAGTIETALEDRKQRREQAENEALQRRGDKSNEEA